MSDVFSFDALTAELNDMSTKYISNAVLPPKNSKRVDFFKKFLRNMVENIAQNSDGSLYDVARIALLYPGEVVDMATSDYWKGVVMRRGHISEEVMQRWPMLMAAVRASAEDRDYDTYPEVLGYFRFFVQKLVEDLRSLHRDDTRDVVAVLRVAYFYPAHIQEMACTRWRASVMRLGFVDESAMQTWACLAENARLAELKPGSEEHTASSVKCAGLLMDVLQSVPAVEEFPAVMRVFPIGVVYTMLTAMRPQLRARFPFIADGETVWRSVVKEWTSTVRGNYDTIHRQAELLCALRVKLLGIKSKAAETAPELTIPEFLEAHCPAFDGSRQVVNITKVLFDPEYKQAYEDAKKKHAQNTRKQAGIKPELIKKVIVSRVSSLVCEYKAVAVSLLGLKIVNGVRRVVSGMDLSAVPGRKRQIYARFLRLVARLDQDRMSWDEKMATASSVLSAAIRARA